MSEVDQLKIKNDVLRVVNNTLKSDIMELESRISFYKATLEYYANPSIYEHQYVDCGKDGIYKGEPSILKDLGRIARETLK